MTPVRPAPVRSECVTNSEIDGILCARGRRWADHARRGAVSSTPKRRSIRSGEAADAVRRRRYPDGIVTYIIDRNINYTNVCVTACKFCAFYRAPKHAEGWSHPMEEILRRCGEAIDLGATQVMLQGGHHPDYGVEYYEELFSTVKGAYPELVIHSIGPSEILHMAKVSGTSIEEAVRRIKVAGLDSIAGAGAEMLPARPRTAIAPLKESGERWLEVMETAHKLGMESTATMMMGTGETNAERIEHLRMIRDVQDKAVQAGYGSPTPAVRAASAPSSRGPTRRRTTTSRAGRRRRAWNICA